MNREMGTGEYSALLTNPSKTKRETVRRRKQFDEEPIKPEEISEHETVGGRSTGSLSDSLS